MPTRCSTRSGSSALGLHVSIHAILNIRQQVQANQQQHQQLSQLHRQQRPVTSTGCIESRPQLANRNLFTRNATTDRSALNSVQPALSLRSTLQHGIVILRPLNSGSTCPQPSAPPALWFPSCLIQLIFMALPIPAVGLWN